MCAISIIVPVYNVENYLCRCIDSLIKQKKFENIEVILVNDGSTDLSGTICDQYMKTYSNIKVIHKKNGGLSDTRNEGLKYITGDYVGFLDSDDHLESSFINDMLAIIKKDKPDMICYGYAFERNDTYKLRGSKKIEKKSTDDVIDELLKCIIGNQICFNIYSRKLFDGFLFPKGRVYEDIATFYKLILKSKKIVKVDYTYYIYNIMNNNSITKNSSLKSMKDMYLSVNEQCDSISNYYDLVKKPKDYLNYYRLDKYIYIYFKLKREVEKKQETEKLCNQIEEYILNNYRCNFIKYRYYDWKKYCYFRVIHMGYK